MKTKKKEKKNKEGENSLKKRVVSPTRRGLERSNNHRAMPGLQNTFPRGGRSISHKQSSP